MHFIIGLMLLALSGLAFNAHGAIVAYTDRAAFIAAAGGPLTLEGFDDLSLATGVTLSTGGGYQDIWTSTNCPIALNPCLGLIESASATFTFSPGVTAVGFDYNELNAASLDVALSTGDVFNAALTSNLVNFAYVPRFFGLISDVALNSMTIGSGTDRFGAIYFIDDFRFGAPASVPEPTALSLVGLALAALCWRRRDSRA